MDVLPDDFRRGSLLSKLDSVLPLPLVKKALRVETTDEDDLIQVYMANAKTWIEGSIFRPLDSYQWSVTFNGPVLDTYELVLPMAPVSEVYDPSGSQVLFHTRNGFDAFVDGKGLTTGMDGITLSVETLWSSDHLDGIKHAFLTVVGDMYRNREVTVSNTSASRVVAQALVPFRRTLGLAY